MDDQLGKIACSAILWPLREIVSNLFLHPCQPLPGILDFGQDGVGVFLLELNLISHLGTIYTFG
jgi:hypothetical protein